MIISLIKKKNFRFLFASNLTFDKEINVMLINVMLKQTIDDWEGVRQPEVLTNGTMACTQMYTVPSRDRLNES